MSKLIIRGLRSEPEAEEMFAGGDVQEVLWARSFGKWAFAVHTAKTDTGRTKVFARAALTAYLTGRVEYKPGRDGDMECSSADAAERFAGELMDQLL